MVLLLGLSALLFAAEAQKITGTISVSEDDDGNITGVKLTVDEGTVYNVTMNEAGKKLAEDMNGENVEVVGTVVEKDDGNWITVKKFKKVEEVIEED
jgi:uncharacterized membrane-anchored protein